MKKVKLEKLTESAYWHLIDMTLDYNEDGKPFIRVPVSEKHFQAYGRVHGGVIASMLDASIAVLVNHTIGPLEGATTVELKVNYLQPVVGPNLRAEAELIKYGRTLVVAESKCYENDDKLVATANGTFYRLGKMVKE